MRRAARSASDPSYAPLAFSIRHLCWASVVSQVQGEIPVSRTLLGLATILTMTLCSVCGASVTSGNWYLQTYSQVSATGMSKMPQIGGSLNQTDSSITGILHVSNSDCFDWLADIPVTGTVNGNTATITSASTNGQVITITGTVSSNLISGSYSIAGGCATGDQGTVSGVAVPSTAGNWSGDLSNSGIGQAVAAAISQGAANSDGFYPLGGTLTFSGTPCFASGNLAADQSWILGNQVQAIVNLSDGSQMALNGFLTDAAAAAKQITVNFSVNGGSCSGQSGSLTFSRT
jgi:hypothetical protein